MKELFRELFPYLVLLYLIDGVILLGARHFLFVSWIGARFKLVRDATLYLHLSPLGYAILAQETLVYPTRTGVYWVAGPPGQPAAFYQADEFVFTPYEEMREITADGKQVRVNGKALIKVPAPATAQQIAQVIGELRGLAPPARRQAIQQWIEQTTATAAIQALQERVAQPVVWLETLGLLLFILIFVFLPLALYVERAIPINFQFLGLQIILIWLITLAASIYCYRQVHRISGWAAFQEHLTMLLSPVTAMRAANHLVKDSYAHFDAITVAALLLPAPASHDLLRRTLHRFDAARTLFDDDAWQEVWALRRVALIRMLPCVGTTLDELLASPVRHEADAASYCPVCHSTYRAGFTACQDCGVALLPF